MAQKTNAADKKLGVGYGISQTADAVKVANGLAKEIVREALDMGIHLRTWETETKEKTHQILKLGDRISEGEKDRQKINQAISDVIRWEDEISRSIRGYFIQISDLLNKLKKLNPPLTSEQLDPYLEAILTDRRATMAALDPLSNVIHKIAHLKTQVWFDRSAISQPLP